MEEGGRDRRLAELATGAGGERVALAPWRIAIYRDRDTYVDIGRAAYGLLPCGFSAVWIHSDGTHSLQRMRSVILT
ncbi:hypothetical protein Q8A67_015132 [Cirrhinus molitorella]|uniref:Uncharacterized protein n=1 Tax=Cirrhinus molitorella TaxID=172907 RepID=A0AA88PLE5_9TELE|nr:hypothetical protein Q8A67_015132 [Cirrhinus molitorella]